DEADTKIAEARAAEEAAAKKKTAKTKEATASKKPQVGPVPAPAGPASSAATAPAQQGPAPAVPGNATLKLAFDSPMPEGHVMVAVNDQILLRKPFSFKKNESRTVTATLTVPSGPAAIKAWLSGPDMPSAFATTNAQLSGGENRTLRLELSGGKLNLRLQ